MKLDPRWDWVDVTSALDSYPKYMQGTCNHLTPEPVTTQAGETVALLCPDCDTQLPVPGWS